MEYHADEDVEIYHGDFKIGLMKNWIEGQRSPVLLDFLHAENSMAIKQALKDQFNILFFLKGIEEHQSFHHEKKRFSKII